MCKNTCKKIFALACAVMLAFSVALSLCRCTKTPPEPEPSLDGLADVFVFMGQSNMGGRGDAELSVEVKEGHGYEFRAVTDPTKLYKFEEPFGRNENNDGINDSGSEGLKKSGGLASAFVEAYYAETGVPVIGVSASQGGTNSLEWQPGNGLLDEAQRRLSLCLDYMSSQDEFTVRHIYVLWLQGEADAGKQTPLETYAERMENVFAAMQELGAEQFFVIGIGSYIEEVNPEYKRRYAEFVQLQQTMCEQSPNMTFVSKKLSNMPEKYMHRNNHFLQPAYNVVGNDAGKNAAYYVKTGNAPDCKPYVDGEENDIPGVKGKADENKSNS